MWSGVKEKIKKKERVKKNKEQKLYKVCSIKIKTLYKNKINSIKLHNTDYKKIKTKIVYDFLSR